VAVGTTKKSIATRSRRWFSRNARHVGEGGVLLRGMYLATVETATSMPSMASSLRIRGAPQVTFACAILRISFTTSRSSPARPKRPNQLLRLQKRLNARRCQRTTVAGSTIARASLHRGHCFDRIAQKARSHPRVVAVARGGSEAGRQPAGAAPGSRGRAPVAKQRSRRPEDGPKQAQHEADRTCRTYCRSRRFCRMRFSASTRASPQ
jgi:hypothetical protein